MKQMKIVYQSCPYLIYALLTGSMLQDLVKYNTALNWTTFLQLEESNKIISVYLEPNWHFGSRCWHWRKMAFGQQEELCNVVCAHFPRVNYGIALCSWHLWKLGINSESILRKGQGRSLSGSCTEMIYGHLEREHPRTSVAAQVHFKGRKVTIIKGKQEGVSCGALFSGPILWTLAVGIVK